MIHRALATAALAGLLAISSSASADEISTETISALMTDGNTGEIYITAADGWFTCSFSGQTGKKNVARAHLIDGMGVASTADRRREAMSLLTAAFLAGKQVRFILRRSDTGGTHCRVFAFEIF
jgi:hypothetical protein